MGTRVSTIHDPRRPTSRTRTLPFGLRKRMPGRHVLQLLRLFAFAASVAMGVQNSILAPALYQEMNKSTIWVVIWGYVPFLILPLLIGTTSGLALARGILTTLQANGNRAIPLIPPGSTSVDELGEHTRLDRVWLAMVRIHLTWYAALTITWAILRHLLPADQVAPLAGPHPLSDHLISLALFSPTVLGLRGRFVYVGLLAPFVLLLNTTPGTLPSALTVAITVYFLAHAFLQLAAWTWLLAQARALDHSERAEARVREVLMHQRAQALARRRTNNIVHDHVLSVLGQVGSGLGDMERIHRAARSALATLDSATKEVDATSASSVFNTIRAFAHSTKVPIEVSCTLEEDVALPAPVASTLIEASTEAISNSILHAGDPVPRSITLEATPGRILIRIVDAGNGLAVISPTRGRQGLRHSIFHAMEEIGGGAAVLSAPGLGTVVRLRWEEAQPICVPLFPWMDPIDEDEDGLKGHVPASSPLHQHTLRIPGRERAAHDVHPAPAVEEHSVKRGTIQRRLALLEQPWLVSLRHSLQTRVARLLVGLHFVVAAWLCLLFTDVYPHPWRAWAALALVGSCAYLLTKRWPQARMRPTVGTWVAVAALAAHILLLTVVPSGPLPQFPGWTMSSVLLIALALLVRSQVLTAWGLLVGYGVSTMCWTWVVGVPISTVLPFIETPILTGALWHLLLLLSGAAAGSVTRRSRDMHKLWMDSRFDVALHSELVLRLHNVSERVRPLLMQLASAEEVTEDLRRTAMLTEAELRDEIRAPFFTGTPVPAAARSARERGIEVLLYDDSHQEMIGAQTRSVIINECCRALDAATYGRVVLRVLPPGRSVQATITGDSVPSVRLGVTRSQHAG